jgi:hypothetical protein
VRDFLGRAIRPAASVTIASTWTRFTVMRMVLSGASWQMPAPSRIIPAQSSAKIRLNENMG